MIRKSRLEQMEEAIEAPPETLLEVGNVNAKMLNGVKIAALKAIAEINAKVSAGAIGDMSEEGK